ncbi:DegT/DnrJ/EryC1/StrS family aminotransferase [Bradyrhizobium liaoningense]|uniref:DegT/DnrJ/EryC1/StrS family aminotransferase n=1 Tax=Bradyrhizobium liaoningense TaxID=43992 RepID=UPI001BA47701|nr:DegT/DnrJ/EryC1/StrS family aminotransferase [Bradyrhizobium liaoningense]MBR0838848.1 DegT/DnrJ/EryC1/StrS family aminotransferase [Bradyrhizobium liaoningense]
MKFNNIEWPRFGSDEKLALNEVLSSGKWWRNEGRFVVEVEKQLAKVESARNVVAVSNGTHALELALAATGVPRGCGVVLPALTFNSSMSSVQRHGAYPVVADVDLDTWTLSADWREIPTEIPVGAVMPVHYAGIPADLEAHGQIARGIGAVMIQDSAHGPGIRFRGSSVSAYGEAVCYSFQNSKLLPAGEGGAVVFASDEAYERALLVHNCGRGLGEAGYDHREIGSNFRMNEFSAAVLAAQFKRFEEQTRIRRDNAARFRKRLERCEPLVFQKSAGEAGECSEYLVQARLQTDRPGTELRDAVVRDLQALGIPANRLYPPLFTLRSYWQQAEPGVSPEDLANRCRNSVRIAETGFCLHHRMFLAPPDLIERFADSVASVVREALVSA